MNFSVEYFYSNGNIKKSCDTDDFYIKKNGEIYTYENDEIFYELDNELVKLYEKIKNKIFISSDNFEQIEYLLPIWVADAGINSDLSISKFQFESFCNQKYNLLASNFINKYLYYYDIYNLIGSVQSNLLIISELFIYFYEKFCNWTPLNKIKGLKNSKYWESGKEVTYIISILSNIIITIYSTFDLLTKIIYETENLHIEFDNYPKFRSKNILFNPNIKLNLDKANTIFDTSENIQLIINLRNELIHNSFWEFLPKIYFRVENEIIIEKFIFYPDNQNGNIEKFINRNKFFSKELKINKRLPELIFNILQKVLVTIKKI